MKLRQMKKKILLICTINLGIGDGISKFVLDSAKELRKLGNDVTILTSNNVDILIKEDLKKQGIALKDKMRRNSTLQYFINLIKVIREERYDIVHVHGNSNTMSIELVAAQIAGCKVRISHGHNTKTDNIVLHRILTPFFKESVTSRFACGVEAGNWLYHNKDFYIVNNGIDLENYKFNVEKRKVVRRSLGIGEGDILIGHVGSFNYQKNQKFLLDVIFKLGRKYKLLFLGDGDERKKVQKMVNERNISDRVMFMGNVSDVLDYLNAMDIFVLPSHFEGLPFSLIEAKATGLPCILSDKISREANLASMIYFLSIEDSAEWCDKIREISKERIDRVDSSNKSITELSFKGYDIKENMIKMNKKYDSLLMASLSSTN